MVVSDNFSMIFITRQPAPATETVYRTTTEVVEVCCGCVCFEIRGTFLLHETSVNHAVNHSTCYNKHKRLTLNRV